MGNKVLLFIAILILCGFLVFGFYGLEGYRDKIVVFIGEDARKLIEEVNIEIPHSAKDLYIFNNSFWFDRTTYIGMTVPIEDLKEYNPRRENIDKVSFEDLYPGIPFRWNMDKDDIGPQKYGEKYRTPLWDLKAMEDPVTLDLSSTTFIYDRVTERLLIIDVVF